MQTIYAGIMGMMGLPVMHHTTWDSLVAWVGTHIEQLANWSCDQVRADIVKRGDNSGQPALMAFI